jgi:uncharacterized protein (TIGR03086 family)
MDGVAPGAAFGLLERAISYALGTVPGVTADGLGAPTPCAGWDLRTLLQHVNESLDLLHECLAGPTATAPPATDPLDLFRARATRLVAAFSRPVTQRVVIAGGCPLALGVIARTGALEIAVHGWDISRAIQESRPIPNELASDLLGLCPVLVADARHHRLFAPPVPLPPAAGPSDQLVALLGRDPAICSHISPGAMS